MFSAIVDQMTIGDSSIMLMVNEKEFEYNNEKEEDVPVKHPI